MTILRNSPGLSLIAGAVVALLCSAAFGEASVSRIARPEAGSAVPVHAAGRTLPSGNGGFRYQWPGLYFESAFDGTSIDFTLGTGEVILNVLVDGRTVDRLVKPAAGRYRIEGLTQGRHHVRIEAVTESQSGPNEFGGFALAGGGKPVPVDVRPRQIEFIGDSHTVGYGNTSRTRDCTEADVWATTDNAQAFGAKVARHYDADYQINAISGRGIVRNYDGFAADTLPQAYPFTLFDHANRYDEAAWQPQIVVIALGTNDFSTALHDGERWANRDALHADYEATYVRFVRQLRAAHPAAFFILWATDMADGEIQAEAGKVVARLQSDGERRIGFLAINELAMTGCHWHPSVADDDAIAARLIALIDTIPQVWKRSPE